MCVCVYVYIQFCCFILPVRTINAEKFTGILREDLEGGEEDNSKDFETIPLLHSKKATKQNNWTNLHFHAEFTRLVIIIINFCFQMKLHVS